jgi:HSP20 family molecular chaperone IbpA
MPRDRVSAACAFAAASMWPRGPFCGGMPGVLRAVGALAPFPLPSPMVSTRRAAGGGRPGTAGGAGQAGRRDPRDDLSRRRGRRTAGPSGPRPRPCGRSVPRAHPDVHASVAPWRRRMHARGARRYPCAPHAHARACARAPHRHAHLPRPLDPRPQDVTETREAYNITLDVPGVAPEGLSINAWRRLVTIRGRRERDGGALAGATAPATVGLARARDSGLSMLMHAVHLKPLATAPSRSLPLLCPPPPTGADAFERTFKLPPDADEDAISAHLENGVLSIDVPKKPVGVAAVVARRIPVATGRASAPAAAAAGAAVAAAAAEPKEAAEEGAAAEPEAATEAAAEAEETAAQELEAPEVAQAEPEAAPAAEAEAEPAAGEPAVEVASAEEVAAEEAAEAAAAAAAKAAPAAAPADAVTAAAEELVRKVVREEMERALKRGELGLSQKKGEDTVTYSFFGRK